MSNNLVNGNLINDIKTIIEESKKLIVRNVNTIMLQTYWNIGRRIVEEEQSVCDNLVIDNLRHRGSDTIKT